MARSIVKYNSTSEREHLSVLFQTLTLKVTDSYNVIDPFVRPPKRYRGENVYP
jgi:hypothetical protein